MQPTTMIITRVAVPGVENEQLAAHQLGPNTFVVASVPFVDTTLALGDIVECVLVNRCYHVDRVIVRGGSSTVRIMPTNEYSNDDIAETLLALGCRVELGPGGMLAASIGPDCPREGIMEWLDGLEAEGVIEQAPGYTA
ncbi:DUF4265 domain-containing protein [Corynebacterium sanguinis]|uniref:DUF4265 domain-containing protein n=1 Tax=Corynebacterium TaxID=1716 RepID=UPI0011A680EE|nr:MULTISPECIES: DUF4265 domain-containing protein [Corynebacterium]MCT1413932.1 DUF4265 domain-containing protein [Corynebacterium sanguinis]MCT1463128.1 DUF4265 domain-containing protein [Corynebacterium sanguinis]MCT1585461.1 DUF4265 domain-containing protein [Corynebacterium sanguinis]MCT2024152.1 DUF4265 domain-containing protein [Corynebacterium sanguinis]MCT2046227.1 DUF4265 domain-containing protein [Corynebacterium sanguinis]